MKRYEATGGARAVYVERANFQREWDISKCVRFDRSRERDIFNNINTAGQIIYNSRYARVR